MEGGAKVKCKSCNDNKGAYNYSTLCPDDDDDVMMMRRQHHKVAE